jgi:hypothetical protein
MIAGKNKRATSEREREREKERERKRERERDRKTCVYFFSLYQVKKKVCVLLPERVRKPEEV